MTSLLFPIGQVSLYVAHSLIVSAWLMFSFLFWRSLRQWGIEEDRIFDLTFYSTLSALAVSRIGYIVTNWDVFAGKSLLLLLALWVSPGLSWLFGLVGGLGTLVFLSRRYKVRLGWVLDTLAVALPFSVVLGEIASLVGGLSIGRPTGLVWAVRFVGHEGARHPVQLYAILMVVALGLGMAKFARVAAHRKLPYGVVGVWFFLLYSLGMFALEFFKDSHVYWGGLTANQWILIGVFAECIGVIYVRGGGREYFRPLARGVVSFIQKKGKNIYESVSRRGAR